MGRGNARGCRHAGLEPGIPLLRVAPESGTPAQGRGGGVVLEDGRLTRRSYAITPGVMGMACSPDGCRYAEVRRFVRAKTRRREEAGCGAWVTASFVIPAQAGTHGRATPATVHRRKHPQPWVPAVVGMTKQGADLLSSEPGRCIGRSGEARLRACHMRRSGPAQGARVGRPAAAPVGRAAPSACRRHGLAFVPCSARERRRFPSA